MTPGSPNTAAAVFPERADATNPTAGQTAGQTAGRRPWIPAGFPLVARPVPACPPLPVRVAGVDRLATAAGQSGGATGLAMAAAAHTQAALIAADLGGTTLARALCRRQLQLFLAAAPLDAHRAKLALEPVRALARMAIRAGDGEQAHHLLTSVERVVAERGSCLIEGGWVDFARLCRTEDDLQALRRWWWTVLLSDGTQALASVGRFADAAAHAQTYRGVGRRLLEGRQVSVLAEYAAGLPRQARQILHRATPTQPWEHAVAAVLTVLCGDPQPAPGEPPKPAVAQVERMRRHFDALDTDPALLVFRIRLAAMIVTVASGQSASSPIAARVIVETLHTATDQVTDGGVDGAMDGAAAAEILRYRGLRAWLTSRDQRRLVAAARTAGMSRTRAIGAGPVRDGELPARLSPALHTAEATITRLLRPPPTRPTNQPHDIDAPESQDSIVDARPDPHGTRTYPVEVVGPAGQGGQL